MKYLPPKGTQDLWGDAFYAYDSIAKTILKVTEQYGFRQLRTPGFDAINILAKSAGSEIVDQIYTFEDKGGRPMGIKSDITPAVARFVAGNGQSMPKPIKIVCYDRVYRYERPQAGRDREITQINAELFGAQGSLSEADLLACLYQCYAELKLPEVVINVGFRPLLEQYIRNQNVADDKVMAVARLIDKRDKITELDFAEEIKSLGLDERAQRNITVLLNLRGPLSSTLKKANKAFAGDEQMLGYVQRLKEVADRLQNYGISANFQLNLGLARGLEYYTGIIFEVKMPGSRYGSIGSGGRYDDLVGNFGGADTPAVGFSVGLNRIYLVLEECGRLDQVTRRPVLDYYLVSDGRPETCQALILYAQKLRAQDLTVEFDLLGKSLSKQLQTAKALGAQQVVLFKAETLKAGCVQLLDLVMNKEQTLTREDIA